MREEKGDDSERAHPRFDPRDVRPGDLLRAAPSEWSHTTAAVRIASSVSCPFGCAWRLLPVHRDVSVDEALALVVSAEPRITFDSRTVLIVGPMFVGWTYMTMGNFVRSWGHDLRMAPALV